MAASSSNPIKFAVQVKNYMKNARQTYMLTDLVNKLVGIVPPKIMFSVSNGDIYEGHFSFEKQCFIGLRELLNRFPAKDLSMLSFEYVGGGRFTVVIFDSTAVEIEYPMTSVVVKRKDVDFRRIPGFTAFNYTADVTLEDKIAAARLKFNSGDSHVLKASVYMPENVYEDYADFVRLEAVDEDVSKHWVDGSSICLYVDNHSWNVLVHHLSDRWFLCEGWSSFASEIGVGPGDLMDLHMSGSYLRFEVAFYKDYASVPLCVQKNLVLPSCFFKTVTPYMLETCELTIPSVYRWKYGIELEAEMEIVDGFGVSYHCFYLELEEKLVLLKEFIAGNNLKTGQTIMFSQNSLSKLFVTIYDHEFVDIAMA